MSYPQGDELVQNTNAYYQTAYALVFKPGTGPRRRRDARRPAPEGEADRHRRRHAAGHQHGDERADGEGAALPAHGRHAARHLGRSDDPDLQADEIDVAVLWGPLAGYYAKQADPPLTVVPLLKEQGGSRMVFRITMGVRPSDQEWKRRAEPPDPGEPGGDRPDPRWITACRCSTSRATGSGIEFRRAACGEDDSARDFGLDGAGQREQALLDQRRDFADVGERVGAVVEDAHLRLQLRRQRSWPAADHPLTN